MKNNKNLKKLVRDAQHYFEEAQKQTDPRQKAEKGWLATTLAVNAIVLSKKGYKPRGYRERLKAIIEISRGYSLSFTHAAEILHQDCFYEGVCEPLAIQSALKEVRGLVKAAHRSANGKA